MTDGPYDYARERYDAESDWSYGTRRIGGQVHHENDVPDDEDAS